MSLKVKHSVCGLWITIGEMGQLTLIAFATLLCCSTPLVDGGKVLVYSGEGSLWINMKVIVEELHSRGHEVTVIRPSNSWYIKPDSPHYDTVTVDFHGAGDEEFFGTIVARMVNLRRDGSSVWARMASEWELVNNFYEMLKASVQTMEIVFEDSEMIKRLQDAKYDMVLTDPVGPGPMLARRLGLPLVLSARWTVQGEAHDLIAPCPLSYVPVPDSMLTDKMTFPQRIKNALFYLLTRIQYAYMSDSLYTAFVHRYFGPDVNYIELFQAADIWLMRSDFTFEYPRPTMPNVVYMQGWQCKPSEPLPPHLEDFVQSSGEHGVVVMTLGSFIGKVPEDVTEAIAAAFARLPQKVIWRHTGGRPSTLGNNTLVVDWLPQKDLLGHPKTRVFVAHGGTNGIQEAIYHGVPLVGLPILADQEDNMNRMEAKGVAKVVDIGTINEDNFLEALKEVLREPSYKENMQRLSRLHRDQPMKPLDRAMFWIEFVMRHKGAPHLRTESYKMSTIQYRSIDVVAFLMAAVSLAMIVCISAIRLLCRKVFCRSKAKRE